MLQILKTYACKFLLALFVLHLGAGVWHSITQHKDEITHVEQKEACKLCFVQGHFPVLHATIHVNSFRTFVHYTATLFFHQNQKQSTYLSTAQGRGPPVFIF